MDEKELIKGEVSHIIYYNEENGYTVAEMDEGGFNFICVGMLYGVHEGEILELNGSWTEHSTYGEQFKVDFYKKILPTSCDDICRYLSAGIIKGVRKATATKIVEKFGEDALNVISQEPKRLAMIKGISLNKAIEISKSFNMQLGTSELFMFLNKFGISANVCMKIYRRFKTLSRETVLSNPYILCDDECSVSFSKADEIAMQNGFVKSDSKRIESGILYCLKVALAYGHTYLPRHILCANSASVLSLSKEVVDPYIDVLCHNMQCIGETDSEGENIYLAEYYKYESYIAKKLSVLSSMKRETHNVNIEPQIDIAEINSSIRFAKLQREAIRCALCESVMVITGGPGTGKTTIINAIIDIMKSQNLKISLAAPTGRAAKRMTELCGEEAKTIHRLLEVCYSEGNKLECTYNESEPLQTDVIIVDEMSMVDVVLMNSLLKATRPGTRLIMVGDVNQLPSVGAGNVLKDIIRSGKIPVICLNEVFRQSENSMIAVNAHDINDGSYPVCNTKDGDFFFASIEHGEGGAKYICELCSERLKKTYGYQSGDIQVLSPIKKGTTGVVSLNSRLQALLNPPQKGKKEKAFGDIIFREGDKVMQIRNNYNMTWLDTSNGAEGLGIFNGDVGFIKEINNDLKTVTVMFDEKKLVYDFKELADLSLAYCITVHKSQGSEFPVVIIPMYPGPDMIQNRNLFYTGVTRAKNLVILVGRKDVMYHMVDNNREDLRYSGLEVKIRNEYTSVF